jgi:chromosome segregation ATPase
MKLSAGWLMPRAILLSAVILVGLTALNVNPFVTFPAALAPMVAYHVFFLRPRARAGELTSLEIDSIYYYGFLLTILALATSALTVVVRGVDKSLAVVGAQFGLGLLATGYAVAARIQLLLSARAATANDDDDVLESYINRSRELISSIELASSSFDTYARSLQDRVTAAAAESHSRTELVLSDAARAFTDGISATLEESKSSIAEIRAFLNDAAFTSEREELKKSVQSSVSALTKLNNALERMAELSSSSANSTGEFVTAVGAVSERAVLLSERLEGLSAENGTLVRFQQQLSSSAEQVSRAVDELQQLPEQLHGVGAAAAGVAGDLDALAESAAGTGKSIKPLAGAAERIAEIVSSLEAADGALSAMKDTGSATASELERLRLSILSALPLLEQFGKVGEQSTPTLKSMGDHVQQLEQVASALAPVATSMASISDVLSNHAEQLRSTAAANDELLQSITETVRTAPAFQEALGSIPDSLNRIDDSLRDTAEKLVTAGDTLQSTATASVDCVRQLEEGLAGVATFIIEKTNQRTQSEGRS